MIKKLLAAMLALFAAVAFAAVDANKATQAELETVKGIGPTLSAKIIEERNKGAFKNWQDMVDRVKGVGESNATKFSTEGLTVNGAAFAGAPAKAATPSAKASAPAVKADAKPAPKVEEKKVAAPVAASAPGAAAKAEAKPTAMSADDKKAAKAAAAEEARKAKAEKAAAKKAAKENKPAAAAASAPASAAKK